MKNSPATAMAMIRTAARATGSAVKPLPLYASRRAAPFSTSVYATVHRTSIATPTSAIVRSGFVTPARQFSLQSLASALHAPKTSINSNKTTTTTRLQTLRLPAETTQAVTPTTAIRFASSSSASTATSAPSSDAAADSQQPLDWNTFFALRKKRRRYQVAASVVFAALGVVGGSIVLGSGAMDWLVGQFPLDPLIALGILTIAFGVLGWLAGPSVGSQLFYLRNGRWKAQMTRKEVEFFARIRKHRVDPSNSSAGNPGEWPLMTLQW